MLSEFYSTLECANRANLDGTGFPGGYEKDAGHLDSLRASSEAVTGFAKLKTDLGAEPGAEDCGSSVSDARFRVIEFEIN